MINALNQLKSIDIFNLKGIESRWYTVKRRLPSSGRYKIDGYLLVYLWHEQVKRSNKDPLYELLKLIGESSDNFLDKEIQWDRTPEHEEGAASGETMPAAAVPEVVMLPCIFCSKPCKVHLYFYI